MKPLFEQLTKDNQQKLVEHYKDLQATYKSILDELKRAEYRTYIQTNIAFDIWSALHPHDAFSLNDFWELFKRQR